MGRPQVYADKAERMRAYRARRKERVLEVNRPALESMEDRLRRLRDAVRSAADAGDMFARSIDTFTLEDTLEGITNIFLLASKKPLLTLADVPDAIPPFDPFADVPASPVAPSVPSVALPVPPVGSSVEPNLDRFAVGGSAKSPTAGNSLSWAARRQMKKR